MQIVAWDFYYKEKEKNVLLAILLKEKKKLRNNLLWEIIFYYNATGFFLSKTRQENRLRFFADFSRENPGFFPKFNE